MIVAARYSFNNGARAVGERWGTELREIEAAIAAVDATLHKTKSSEERTMPGRLLYNPRTLNDAFQKHLYAGGWHAHRERCEYSLKYYTDEYTRKAGAMAATRGAFREMDYVKRELGIEVQFGKYAFMVYNVCAKMTIFHNKGVIAAGVEVVPVKTFAEEMSTGVSYFEQFVWDLEQRGVADIDVPVLILGIDA